jgi:hypothetical protein
MGPAEERRRTFLALNADREVQDVTSLAEAERKYGHVVQSAGGQVFGIESGASLTGRAEKLKIGTPDGFLKIDVVLNQPNIDAVLRERTADIVKHARELRTPSRPALGVSTLPSARR